MGTYVRSSSISLSQDPVFQQRYGATLVSTGGRPRTVQHHYYPAGRPEYPSNSIGSVSWSPLSTINDRCLVQGLGRIVGPWIRTTMGVSETRGRRRRGERIILCAGGEKNDKKSGDDQVETLFMRELRRRGITSKDGSLGSAGTETKTKEENSEDGGRTGRGWSLPGMSRTKPPPELTEAQRTDQLKRSMALNSEGLDGLIPRATELLKLGSTFFFVFWPFIAASLAAFLAVYLYFGTAFVHTGSSFEKVGRPPYVDPYQLLEEEVLPSRIGPNRVPFNSRADGNS